MATEKILNTRVQLKYDTLANWSHNNPTLLAGELAIVSLGNSHTETTPDNGTHPILFKVGPGQFNDLPWASALAADVYAWAKKEHLELADLPDIPVVDEETGIFVTDVEWDDANNQLIIHRGDESKDYGKITGNTGTIEADSLHDEVKIVGSGVISTVASGDTLTIGADLSDYATKSELPTDFGVMSVSGKEAIKANSTNKKNVEVSLALDNTGNITLTQSDSGLKATVDTGVMSVATGSTNGTIAVDGSEVAVAGLGSAAYTDASDYKTKQTVVSDPTADGSATAFIDSISQNANGEIVVTKKNITAADLGLSGAMHFKGVKTTLPDVADYNEGDVVIVGGKEYVLALNGEGNAKTWNELGDEGSHALKTITITGTDGLTGGGSLEANRTIGIATSGVTTTKIADKNVTKDKLSDEVQASLAKADSALQEHQSLAHLKAKQTAVTNKITDAAHVLTSLTQNENGDISYDVKTLTPADIGAQVAGDYALKSELPTVNDGKLTVSTEAGVLTGSGEFTANQVGDTSISIGIADKGINTAKIDDQAVGAAQTKAYQTATPTKDNPNSEEIWVFYCGTSDILV